MAVALRSSSTNTVAGSPATCTLPAGIQIGDVLVLVYSLRMNSSDATTNAGTTPTGWTRKQTISTTNGSNAGSIILYEKVATGTETNISIAQGGGLSRSNSMCIMAFSGAVAYQDVSGISDPATNTASPVSVNTPSITMAAAGIRVICCAAISTTSLSGTPYTTPSGFTQVAQLASVGSFNSLYVAYHAESSGATGTQAVVETGFAAAGAGVTFGVTGATGTVVNLSGISATAAEGSFAPKSRAALSGVSGTAAEGSFLAKVRPPISGVAASGAVGTLGPRIKPTLAGVAATAAAGVLAPILSVALHGAAATAGTGSFLPRLRGFVTGITATGLVGDLTPPGSTVVNLTGVSAAGALGSLAPRTRAALAGMQATGALGTLRSRTRPALSGIIATSAAGHFSVSIAPRLSGIHATGQVGSFVFAAPMPRLVSITFTNVGLAASVVFTNAGLIGETTLTNIGPIVTTTITDLD